jgi:hypothetical protein
VIQQTISAFLFRVFNTSQRCCLRISSFFHDVQERSPRDLRSKTFDPDGQRISLLIRLKKPACLTGRSFDDGEVYTQYYFFRQPLFSFFFQTIFVCKSTTSGPAATGDVAAEVVLI